MNEKIPQYQLDKIVAEVDRLSRHQESELTRQQVEEILEELNLSSELLHDAIIQLERKKALAMQQRRNRWIGVAIVTVLIIALSSTLFSGQNYQKKLETIGVYQSRITLGEDKGENLGVIERQNNAEVYYRVTLKEAPVGEKLNLKCDWIDPSGQIAHQNNYETRQINTTLWQTHCRYQIEAASPAGNWQVQMSLGDQVFSQKSFVVK
ncbi:MAG: hypothetical protein N5P05_001668 [Chroococcopsis gigantea SAG 12.99]|jgi:hypothetical protein|nr:hypothetical protein [Chroococcopsis gigantea SAG 12.99]